MNCSREISAREAVALIESQIFFTNSSSVSKNIVKFEKPKALVDVVSQLAIL